MYIEDAVAAIIYNENNEILLHLRDDKEDIWFPNHWGLFGGAIEKGEKIEEALEREVFEEIELQNFNSEFFSEFQFNFIEISPKFFKRYYYKIFIEKSRTQYLQLHEGQKFSFFSENELNKILLTPYDSFVLNVYFNMKKINTR